MTREDFEKKLKELKELKIDGVEIDILQQPIDENHLHCFWYVGEIARIKYKDHIISIGCYEPDFQIEEDGELIAEWNGEYSQKGLFNTLGGRYTDKDLLDLENDSKMVWYDVNTFYAYYLFKDDNGEYDYCDEYNWSVDYYFEAFDHIQEYLKDIDQIVVEEQA